MSITTTDYFKSGLKNIPNQADQSIVDTIEAAIELHEYNYLIAILGVELYDAFMADLDEDTLSDRFDKLLNGAEFSLGNARFRWDGFENDRFDTPAAYYIMVNYLRENESIFTGIGEQRSISENTQSVSIATRVQQCWNAMAEQNIKLIGFIKSSGLYPEFKGITNERLLQRFSPFGIMV